MGQLRAKAAKYEPYYEKFVFAFSLFFAFYTLIGRVTLWHELVEHTIDAPIHAMAGLIGFFLFGIDFLFFQRYRRMKAYPFYFLFIFLAGVSSLLNIRYGVTDNAKTICWLIFHMLVLTSFGFLISKKYYHLWLKLFFMISGAMWWVATVVSLYQFLFVPAYRIAMNDRMIRQSFCENRLFGVYIDPNLGAFVAYLVILGMCYLIQSYPKDKLVRGLCIFNIVLQIIYIILSGSRSTIVCMMVSLAYLIFTYVKRFNRIQYHWSRLKEGVVSGVLILLVCLLILVGFPLFQKGAAAVGMAISPELHTSTDELDREDIENDTSTKRIQIWSDYIMLWKTKPWFGLSPRNGWTYADVHAPDSYLSIHHYDVHNAYIAVFEGMGIIGFTAFLIMAFYLLEAILPKYLNEEKVTKESFIALQFILTIAVFIIFYPGIYFTHGIDTLLFWPAIGYMTKDAKKPAFLPDVLYLPNPNESSEEDA